MDTNGVNERFNTSAYMGKSQTYQRLSCQLVIPNEYNVVYRLY